MGTRCTVNFHGHEDRLVGKIYKHWDGNPEEMLEVLEQFLSDVANQTQVSRFRDPSYLSAKYVVWQAAKYATDKDKPLDFSSVGIMMGDPGDIEYSYHLYCNRPGTHRPEIEYDDVYTGKRYRPHANNGGGTYKVIIDPPVDGLYEGVREIQWECNHYNHAVNKAKKRGLIVESIELMEEEA